MTRIIETLIGFYYALQYPEAFKHLPDTFEDLEEEAPEVRS